jgi:hypothetical protein
VQVKKPRLRYKLVDGFRVSAKADGKRFEYKDQEVSFKLPKAPAFMDNNLLLANTSTQKENVPPSKKPAKSPQLIKTAAFAAIALNNNISGVGTATAMVAADKEEVDDRETNRRSPNGFLLPDPLPRGEILVDSFKQEWVLGKPIGLGGFGELYLAATKANGKLSPENYVIKIEPHSNGPGPS